MRRRIKIAVGLAFIAAMPLTAYLAISGTFSAPMLFEWAAASGPVRGYEACIFKPGVPGVEICSPRVPAAWGMKVRAYAINEEGERYYGDWSEPRGLIAVPEPAELILLAAGIGGLAVISRVRARSRALRDGVERPRPALARRRSSLR